MRHGPGLAGAAAGRQFQGDRSGNRRSSETRAERSAHGFGFGLLAFPAYSPGLFEYQP